MKTIQQRLLLFYLLISFIAACSTTPGAPKQNRGPTQLINTSRDIAPEILRITPTQPPTQPMTDVPSSSEMTALQEATPTPLQAVVIPQQPNEQVYIDPDSWYSINFPAGMAPAEKPNAFKDKNQWQYLETGYLPQLGYMNHSDVCFWYANQEETDPMLDQVTLDWAELSCEILIKKYDQTASEMGKWKNISFRIYENPGAAPEKRFIYIALGWDYDRFETSFSWLRPINQTRTEPTLSPLSVAESASWEKMAPIMQGATVSEYASSKAPDDLKEEQETNQEGVKLAKLESLGYELRKSESVWKQLFRDGKLLIDHVYGVPTVYTFSTSQKKNYAFVVNVDYSTTPIHDLRTNFLVQNDAILPWDYLTTDFYEHHPIIYQDEFLWVREGNLAGDDRNIHVIKSSREPLGAFMFGGNAFRSTVNAFAAWDGHWFLKVEDFLVQDGKIINSKDGFQQVLYWSIYHNKPIYLFRKGQRVGLFYDGKVLPLEYQDVTRYRSGEAARSNLFFVSENKVHFYAQRNGTSYYVAITLPGE